MNEVVICDTESKSCNKYIALLKSIKDFVHYSSSSERCHCQEIFYDDMKKCRYNISNDMIVYTIMFNFDYDSEEIRDADMGYFYIFLFIDKISSLNYIILFNKVL